MPPSPRRRWYQFTVRTLLIALVLVSIPLSWLAAQLEKARRQRAAVEAIEAVGGVVLFDTDDPDTPRPRTAPFFYTLLGRDSLDQVTSIYLVDCSANDTHLRHIARFPNIETLVIGNTGVTDSGLQHLHGLRRLDLLWLYNNQISDAGLRQLTVLRSLSALDVYEPRVTEKGLALF